MSTLSADVMQPEHARQSFSVIFAGTSAATDLHPGSSAGSGFRVPALEATQGQNDSFFSQLCHGPASREFKNSHSTEMCCGTEAGACLRLIDSCITQLTAQGPSRTCTESKEGIQGPVQSRFRVQGSVQVEGSGFRAQGVGLRV